MALLSLSSTMPCATATISRCHRPQVIGWNRFGSDQAFQRRRDRQLTKLKSARMATPTTGSTYLAGQGHHRVDGRCSPDRGSSCCVTGRGSGGLRSGCCPESGLSNGWHRKIVCVARRPRGKPGSFCHQIYRQAPRPKGARREAEQTRYEQRCHLSPIFRCRWLAKETYQCGIKSINRDDQKTRNDHDDLECRAAAFVNELGGIDSRVVARFHLQIIMAFALAQECPPAAIICRC